MTSKSWWIFLVPILSFLIGAGLFIRSESVIRVKFERAQEQWRMGANEQAISLYSNLREEYPDSEFAIRALWETATICYYNLYDLNKAIFYFEELIALHPRSEYTVKSHLKLAEIYESELNDTVKALEHLVAVSLEPSDSGLAENIRFQIAEAYFKLENFDIAMNQFQPIIEDSSDLHLVQKALLRTGTILQIQKLHSASIEYFQRVLNESQCDDCRLQAQLGLIESYELVDRIGDAIEIAEQIDGNASHSDNIQELLLQRLLEKQKHYEPKLWSRR